MNEPARDVQQPIPERLWFGLGQVSVESQHLEPGDQVGGDHGQRQPGLVDAELPRREPAQAGVLGVTDPVLNPGMGPMPGLKELQSAAVGVGGERLVAPPVGLFEQG